MKEKYEIQLFPVSVSASWNLFVSRKKPNSVTHKFVCLFAKKMKKKEIFPLPCHMFSVACMVWEDSFSAFISGYISLPFSSITVHK